jgi:hypothetical protein
MTDDPEVFRSDVPMDWMTALTAEMTEPLTRPENGEVKAIVFLNDGRKGGIHIWGYEEEAHAVADLFVHMQAIFRAMGKELQFVGIPETPEGLDDL